MKLKLLATTGAAGLAALMLLPAVPAMAETVTLELWSRPG